jgi:hypothetical protein
MCKILAVASIFPFQKWCRTAVSESAAAAFNGNGEPKTTIWKWVAAMWSGSGRAVWFSFIYLDEQTLRTACHQYQAWD